MTSSLNITLTDKVPPSDLSNAVETKSIFVISACPIPTDRSAPVATKISVRFLEPTVFFRTQPSDLATQFFLSASESHYGLLSSASDTPHNAIFLSSLYFATFNIALKVFLNVFTSFCKSLKYLSLTGARTFIKVS